MFFGAEKVDDIRVTSPIQTYLDLKSLKGRGEEAAQFLRQQIIQKRWQNTV